jgi:hypothetical protein
MRERVRNKQWDNGVLDGYLVGGFAQNPPPGGDFLGNWRFCPKSLCDWGFTDPSRRGRMGAHRDPSVSVRAPAPSPRPGAPSCRGDPGQEFYATEYFTSRSLGGTMGVHRVFLQRPDAAPPAGGDAGGALLPGAC